MPLSEKKSHPLLTALLQLTALRQREPETVERLQRQQQWLIELERLLNPTKPENQPPRTAAQAEQAVEHYLNRLLEQTQDDPANAKVAAHIQRSVRHRWWGLFTCFRVPGVPHTNNRHEQFFNSLKHRQRRITGRKSVQDFIVRYGPYAAYLDFSESFDELLARLQQVAHRDFVNARHELRTVDNRLRQVHRYQHHREQFYADIETRWDEAIRQSRKPKRK